MCLRPVPGLPRNRWLGERASHRASGLEAARARHVSTRRAPERFHPGGHGDCPPAVKGRRLGVVAQRPRRLTDRDGCEGRRHGRDGPTAPDRMRHPDRLDPGPDGEGGQVDRLLSRRCLRRCRIGGRLGRRRVRHGRRGDRGICRRRGSRGGVRRRRSNRRLSEGRLGVLEGRFRLGRGLRGSSGRRSYVAGPNRLRRGGRRIGGRRRLGPRRGCRTGSPSLRCRRRRGVRHRHGNVCRCAGACRRRRGRWLSGKRRRRLGGGRRGRRRARRRIRGGRSGCRFAARRRRLGGRRRRLGGWRRRRRGGIDRGRGRRGEPGRRRWERWARRQQRQRVDVPLLFGRSANAEIDERNCELRRPARPDRPDRIALGDRLPAPHTVATEMHQRHGPAVGRPNRHCVAVRRHGAGE